METVHVSQSRLLALATLCVLLISTSLGLAQNIDFISNYLGTALENSDLDNKIACCDATSRNHTFSYADGVMAGNLARGYIGLITGHGYYARSAGFLGPKPVRSAVAAGLAVWQTESATFDTWNGAGDRSPRNSSCIQWAAGQWDALINAQVNAYF